MLELAQNDKPLKLAPADYLFVSLLARSFTRSSAARHAYGIKGDDAEIDSFVAAKLSYHDMLRALDAARSELKENGCLTRAEKRWRLAHYVRESADPDVVMKALQLDNKMTGDEMVVVRDERVNEYVLRAGDVTEVTPSGGGPPPDCYDGV